MPYIKGHKHSEETKKKLSISLSKPRPWRKGKPLLKNRGANNCNWKGGISTYKRKLWLNNQRKIQIKCNGGFHTQGEWETLKAQYNWTCPACGKKEPNIILTIDHIVPVSKGGSNNIENIQPLCRSCNCKKRTKVVFYKL